MKKNLSMRLLASGILALFSFLFMPIYGSSNNHNNMIKSLNISTDGNFNFKSFEVEVENDGTYYSSAWLLPTKYCNGAYAPLYTYINNEFIGVIQPQEGNWQSILINDDGEIYLKKGKNIISFGALSPEIPSIETIKVSSFKEEAFISDEAYKEYLSNSIAGYVEDNSIYDNNSFDASTLSANIAHFSNVPLRYTFYKLISFTKDQDIFITSTSSVHHNIDVVFYGTYAPIIVTSSSDENFLNNVDRYEETINGTLTSGSVPPNLKPVTPFNYASSEEMQGLNWKGVSEKALNSDTKIATIHMNVPKSGVYLIRVRHNTNGGLSVADVNIDGKYSYENIPISFNSVNCEIPADGTSYSTMTCCSDFGVDDPFLFIHGASSDKVVGVNDDGKSNLLKLYDLSQWDSFISQKYFIKTSKISVSNYSSFAPVSKCNIIARVANGETETMTQKRIRNNYEASVETLSENKTQIAWNINNDKTLHISANSNIEKVLIYSLTGDIVKNIKASSDSLLIPLTDLNFKLPEIYIVHVISESGNYSKKLIFN